MNRKFIPKIGERYGRYTIIGFNEPQKYKHIIVMCRCDCGVEKLVDYQSLRNGKIVSCGCYGIEARRKGVQSKRKQNEYIIDGDIVRMKASNNDKEIVFDKQFLDVLLPYTWLALDRKRGIPYAICDINGVKHHMHRMILNISKDDPRVVDHINGNGLDNRLCNIRVCEQVNNCMNRRANTSKLHSIYKGVFSSNNGKSYFSSIQVNGRQIYLGSFKNEKDAAIAYDNAAKEHFGEYARLNFPDE